MPEGAQIRTRRTQQERRASTIAKLLDGAITAILDIGYARATVREICRRAGVSQGALFAYFPTRADLMAAAAEEVARRKLATFQDAAPAADDDPITASLAFLQDSANSPLNAVWYELAVAARTDPDLEAAVSRVAQDHIATVQAIAAAQPWAGRYAPDYLDQAVRLALFAFNGAAILDLTPRNAADQARTVQFLADLLRAPPVERNLAGQP